MGQRQQKSDINARRLWPADWKILFFLLPLPQNNVEIPQHKSLKDRCEAAEKLKQSSGCPVPIMVDMWDNQATEAYGAFPERLFIIQHGEIMYEGGMGPYNYVLPEVQDWLEEYKGKQKND